MNRYELSNLAFAIYAIVSKPNQTTIRLINKHCNGGKKFKKSISFLSKLVKIPGKFENNIKKFKTKNKLERAIIDAIKWVIDKT